MTTPLDGLATTYAQLDANMLRDANTQALEPQRDELMRSISQVQQRQTCRKVAVVVLVLMAFGLAVFGATGLYGVHRVGTVGCSVALGVSTIPLAVAAYLMRKGRGQPPVAVFPTIQTLALADALAVAKQRLNQVAMDVEQQCYSVKELRYAQMQQLQREEQGWFDELLFKQFTEWYAQTVVGTHARVILDTQNTHVMNRMNERCATYETLKQQVHGDYQRLKTECDDIDSINRDLNSVRVEGDLQALLQRIEKLEKMICKYCKTNNIQDDAIALEHDLVYRELQMESKCMQAIVQNSENTKRRIAQIDEEGMQNNARMLEKIQLQEIRARKFGKDFEDIMSQSAS